MGLLQRFPILVWAGAALLGWIAGELIAEEQLLHGAIVELGRILALSVPATERLFEIAGAALVVLIGWLIKNRGAGGISAH